MTEPRHDNIAAATPRIAFYVIPLLLGIGGAALAAAAGLQGTWQIVAVLALSVPVGTWATTWITSPSREMLERRATGACAGSRPRDRRTSR